MAGVGDLETREEAVKVILLRGGMELAWEHGHRNGDRRSWVAPGQLEDCDTEVG